jgi:hypothetical protein
MKFLRILCLIGWLVLPALSLDREAFTFVNYDLDVRVEPAQRRLGARGRITLRNDSRLPQKEIALQISSSLDWRSIRLDGKVVQFDSHSYASDIDHTGALSEAIVTLPHNVSPQATVELEIGYEGVVALDATRLTRIGVPEEKARHSDWDQISKSFTAVRGIGYVAWYPMATESANLSDANSVFETTGRWKRRETDAQMKITLCAASQDGVFILAPVIEGGNQLRSADQADSCATYTIAGLGRAVPLFVSGPYSVLDRPYISINYLLDHRPGAQNYALAAELVVPFVSDWFGVPRKNAEVAELPDPDDAAFESGDMLLTSLSGEDARAYQLAAVHQFTHAAFSSPRPWIYEGLAHFAQALMREQQAGRAASIDFMDLHRTALLDAEKAIPRNPASVAAESLVNTNTEEFYRSKAMYVWWMLRDMVGDAGLKKALAAYHADQDRDAAYVEHLIEAQSKRDLEWFFDSWVYRDNGLPDFRIESAYPRATINGGYVVTVTVENLGSAGAEVPVRLLMINDDEVTKRVEVHAKSKAVLRIEALAAPQEVIVNDGSVPESDFTNNRFKVEIPDK